LFKNGPKCVSKMGFAKNFYASQDGSEEFPTVGI